MKPLCLGSETSHSERIYIVDVQGQGFSLINQKISELRGSELRWIWDSAKDLSHVSRNRVKLKIIHLSICPLVHIKKPTLKCKQQSWNINQFSFTSLPVKSFWNTRDRASLMSSLVCIWTKLFLRKNKREPKARADKILLIYLKSSDLINNFWKIKLLTGWRVTSNSHSPIENVTRECDECYFHPCSNLLIAVIWFLGGKINSFFKYHYFAINT